MKKYIKLSLLPILGFPLVLFAQSTTFSGLVTNLENIVFKPLVVALLTVALVVFFWGMIKYINSLGNTKDKEDGKSLMVWGIIALAVMVSVWGLVNLVISTFDLNNATPSSITLPGSNPSGGSSLDPGGEMSN